LLSGTFFIASFPKVLSGLPLTLSISAFSVLLGIILGLALAFFKIGRIPVLGAFTRVFVSFGRSVPLIVILYLLHYSLPLMLGGGKGVGIHLPAQVAAVIAFSIFSGTYLSEAFRSAYYAVGRQQTEAGLAVGMTEFQVLRRIVIPQAIRSCIPNLTSVIIDTVKGTAIVYNISLFEIMGQATLAASRTYRFIEAYLITLIIYLIVCFIIYMVLKGVERTLYNTY
jgi:L-cystine transport system permease protein